jgi:hypothetical protein
MPNERYRPSNVPLLLKGGCVCGAVAMFWWLAMTSPPAPIEVGAWTDTSTPAPPEIATPEAAVAPKPLLEQNLVAERSLPERSSFLQREVAVQPSVAPPQSQGPFAELQQRFASESRGPSSPDAEAHIRAAFTDPAIATQTLHNVECKHSVCRAELRWSHEHNAGYVLGLTRAVGKFVVPVGIESAGPPEADGYRRVVVYIGLALHVPTQR